VIAVPSIKSTNIEMGKPSQRQLSRTFYAFFLLDIGLFITNGLLRVQ
jgi:hypothetical protein